MPIAKVQMPDGRIGRFEVPEGTSPEDAIKLINAATPTSYTWGEVPAAALKNVPKDIVPALKGVVQPFLQPVDTMESLIKAGSAGLTNILPQSVLQYANPEKLKEAQTTSQAIGGQFTEENLKRMLAEQPVSSAMLGSSLLSGGGSALQKIGQLGKTENIIGRTGEILSTTGKYTNPLTPVVKGAEYVAPKIIKGAESSAKWLMQSALKPTPTQLKSGQAQTAIDTLLEYNISPTKKGVRLLENKLDDLNAQISEKIANSTATLSRDDVISSLQRVKQRFGEQADPVSDLAAIEKTGENFAASHPKQLSVQLAQKLKTGTYRALKGKYGEEGAASVEAQKALANGLKTGIAQKVEDIAALNAEESKIFDTLAVTERRALMEMNKNPAGLALLTQSPEQFALFMADKSAAFKGLLARILYKGSKVLDSGEIKVPRFMSSTGTAQIPYQGILSATQSPITAGVGAVMPGLLQSTQ
jgi:hypothetical protein